MKKTITIKLKPSELEAIKNITDDISAMIGTDFDVSTTWTKNVKAVDAMLKRNGFKRDYN